MDVKEQYPGGLISFFKSGFTAILSLYFNRYAFLKCYHVISNRDANAVLKSQADSGFNCSKGSALCRPTTLGQTGNGAGFC